MDSDNKSYHSESEFYYPDEENVLKKKKTKLLETQAVPKKKILYRSSYMNY